ncbi:hypothetical protein [Amycolatopsis taiwanensis]|uniref:hypothetical protein n=1 Tax=Amycolatopsis taiwanensis TaxID=342230 RepID=UPI002556589B|nr:hypothetical protein [Amycolatopsis taiwanensis]
MVSSLGVRGKDAKTLREYAYMVRRFVHFLDARGRGLLAATESDLKAYTCCAPAGLPDIVQPGRPARIGIREVPARNPTGISVPLRFDPASVKCVGVATELADEWVDYVSIASMSTSRAREYRQAIQSFCRTVDEMLGDSSAAASPTAAHPDLGVVLAEWERGLPAGYRAGSMKPANLASAVRALIIRRADVAQQPPPTPVVRRPP